MDAPWFPPTNVPADAEVENIVVTTADGRTFNLGKPNTLSFRIRRRLYTFKRRKELRNG